MFGPMERAQRQHAADVTRVEALERDKEKLLAEPPAATDFAALLVHDEKLATFDRQISIASGVEKHSAGLLAQVQATAVERDLDARHKAELPRISADRKRVHEVVELGLKMRVLLAEIESGRQRTAAINEQRGHRAHMVDAETGLRQRPGRLEPARTIEKHVWVDSEGNEVPEQIRIDGNGKRIGNVLIGANGQPETDSAAIAACRWISNPAAVAKGWVIEVVAKPFQNPPEMPERLGDLIQLFDLTGAQIWPPL